VRLDRQSVIHFGRDCRPALGRHEVYGDHPAALRAMNVGVKIIAYKYHLIK